ncbi:MAG: tetratricopeptide repeat protein [Ignavibacteria bacterium]
MRLFLKSTLVLAQVLYFTIYIIGCSSAEQTTAKLAYQQGDYAKAEREFEKEVRQNPNNEEAWFYLGMSRIQLNKIDAAEAALKEYRKIGKNSFSTEMINAWGLKYDEGYKNFEKASSTTDSAESMKLYSAALNSFRTALVILPESVFVAKNIEIINGKINTITIKPILDKGVALDKEGKHNEAIEEYKKALNMVEKGNPNYEVVIYNLGVAYLKWGEKIRAENQDKNPDDKSHLEKYKEALPYLEELSGSSDKSNQLLAYELLVQVYGNLNMTDKAMEAIKKRDQLKGENK